MAPSSPPEFSDEAIAAASSDAATRYRAYSKEPYRSSHRANPRLPDVRTVPMIQTKMMQINKMGENG